MKPKAKISSSVRRSTRSATQSFNKNDANILTSRKCNSNGVSNKRSSGQGREQSNAFNKSNSSATEEEKVVQNGRDDDAECIVVDTDSMDVTNDRDVTPVVTLDSSDSNLVIECNEEDVPTNQNVEQSDTIAESSTESNITTVKDSISEPLAFVSKSLVTPASGQCLKTILLNKPAASNLSASRSNGSEITQLTSADGVVVNHSIVTTAGTSIQQPIVQNEFTLKSISNILPQDSYPVRNGQENGTAILELFCPKCEKSLPSKRAFTRHVLDHCVSTFIHCILSTVHNITICDNI